MLFLAAPVLGGRVLGITAVGVAVVLRLLLSVLHHLAQGFIHLEPDGTVALTLVFVAGRICNTTRNAREVAVLPLRVLDRISAPATPNAATTTARELGYPLPVSLVSLQELMNVPLILIVNRRLVAGYLSMGMQIIPIL